MNRLLELRVVAKPLVLKEFHDRPDVEQVEVNVSRVRGLHASLLQIRGLWIQQNAVPLVKVPLILQDFPFRFDRAPADELTVVLLSVRVVGLHEVACSNLNGVLL